MSVQYTHACGIHAAGDLGNVTACDVNSSGINVSDVHAGNSILDNARSRVTPKRWVAPSGNQARALCIVGPTGAGKSAMALHVARLFDGQVVNADSRQVYADFRLITARPTPAEEADCPHHLYGFLSTPEKISAGVWAHMALSTLYQVNKQEHLPIVAGGTGLYVRALFDGIVDIPPVPSATTLQLAEACVAMGTLPLYRRLEELDPAYASRIHPHDRQRIMRALEVFEATGKTFTWWHEQTPNPAPIQVLRLGVGLSLDELTPLLAQRIAGMLEKGAVEEARAALESCPDTEAPGWSGIGCAELLLYIQGALSLEQTRELWLKNTRAYAKRQLTWFRADKRIVWFRPENITAATQLVCDFYKSSRP